MQLVAESKTSLFAFITFSEGKHKMTLTALVFVSVHQAAEFSLRKKLAVIS